MIFIDSNIPMYLVGIAHPRKFETVAWLERLTAERRGMATSAEVFQEILHRYQSTRRLERIEPAWDVLSDAVEIVFAVTEHDVTDAKSSLIGRPGLSARDALHASVMKHHGITEILTFDRGFDVLPWIERLPRER